MVAYVEAHYSVSKEGENPVTNFGWEALVTDDLG